MHEDVMRKHIDLYVNDYSISLGEQGKRAVEKMLNIYQKGDHKNLKPNLQLFMD